MPNTGDHGYRNHIPNGSFPILLQIMFIDLGSPPPCNQPQVYPSERSDMPIPQAFGQFMVGMHEVSIGRSGVCR